MASIHLPLQCEQRLRHRKKARECGSEPVIPIRQNSKQGNDDMMGVYTNIGI
jgi:hypothetical protein